MTFTQENKQNQKQLWTVIQRAARAIHFNTHGPKGFAKFDFSLQYSWPQLIGMLLYSDVATHISTNKPTAQSFQNSWLQSICKLW